MSWRRLLFLYVPEFGWPIVVFFGSVILPLSLFLITLDESPMAVGQVFQIAYEREKLLDLLLMVVPLAFLYQFVGIRLCSTIWKSGIQYADGVIFWFIVLPCVFLLGFNLLVAFYFADIPEHGFTASDVTTAVVAGGVSFLCLIWFEIGVAVGRIVDQSPQPGSGE